MGCVSAQKASDLATEHNFDINPITAVPTPDECPEIFQFHAVSDKDVESVIRGFASNKAPGYDKVSVRVLKDSLPAIVLAIRPAITTIMNNSFNTKTFARSWKIAEVTPVLKSGDSEEPCNHRPISLLPVLSKVSERLANRQFVDFLSANKKLAKTQSGNRKLHSTETALLCVTDDLLRAMDDKKVSVIVLLDMSKAFDSIRHDILLQKLHELGISSPSLDWFHIFFFFFFKFNTFFKIYLFIIFTGRTLTLLTILILYLHTYKLHCSYLQYLYKQAGQTLTLLTILAL